GNLLRCAVIMVFKNDLWHQYSPDVPTQAAITSRGNMRLSQFGFDFSSKLHQCNLQRSRQADKCGQRWLSKPSFQKRDECSVQSAGASELLLRYSPLGSESSQSASKRQLDVIRLIFHWGRKVRR